VHHKNITASGTAGFSRAALSAALEIQ